MDDKEKQEQEKERMERIVKQSWSLGIWKCPKCKAHNSTINDKCLSCGKKR